MTYTAQYASSEPDRADVDAMPGVTIIEFGAPWCPHCIGAQPAIEQTLAAKPELRHIKIEDGSGRRLGRSLRVKLWPTLVALREGVELARVVRPRSRADLDMLLQAV